MFRRIYDRFKNWVRPPKGQPAPVIPAPTVREYPDPVLPSRPAKRTVGPRQRLAQPPCTTNPYVTITYRDALVRSMGYDARGARRLIAEYKAGNIGKLPVLK